MKWTPKAVVFDMDGVLIDARDWHFRALNDALAIFGVEISYEEHLERFNGLPTKVKLRHLSADGRLPTHLHAVVEAVKQERTLREAARMCFPRVEHLLLMAWLRGKSVGIGVATNSVRQTTETMMEFSGLMPFLDVLVTNEDVTEAKPAPDIYLRAAQLLSVDPRDVLVVEDHPVGIAAAQAAGCVVVPVNGVDDVNTSLIAEHFIYNEVSR